MCWQGAERPFVGGGRGDFVLRNAPQPLGETEALASRPSGMCWFTVAFLIQDLWQTVGRLASYVDREGRDADNTSCCGQQQRNTTYLTCISLLPVRRTLRRALAFGPTEARGLINDH